MGPPLRLNMAKVKVEDDSRPPSPATPSVQTPGGTGLKLRFNKPGTLAPAVAPSSASKKRASNIATVEDGPPAKKSKTTTIKTKGPAITIPTDEAPVRKGSHILKLKSHKDSINTPTTPRGIKVKFKGKLPPRPIGAGYDSECDDAEPDPAIEENFILRMAPGADADYIRKAIEERKLGVPVREGGADVSLRFFTKDARRAMVRVQDRFYAAVLVDLPCITESMKSWDKKGWWKSADISQMLLVTERVNNADKAKDIPLPKEINKDSYAWPHGLTPPMHDARRRRFRKRNDYKSVEKLEEEVERLLAEDQKARANGGTSETIVTTMAEWDREQNPPSESDRSEAEGDSDNGDYDQQGYEEQEEELDPEALANLNALWEEADDDEQEQDTSTVAAPAPTTTAPQTSEVDRSGSTLEISRHTQTVTTPDGGTAEVSHEVVPETQQDASMSDAATLRAISQAIVSTPGTSPSGDATPPAAGDAEVGSAPTHSSDDDSASDADDDEDASDEELSEEAREARERWAQQKEEIAHLEGQIAEKKQLLANTTSKPMQLRIRATIKQFEENRDVKKRNLGLPVGDEDVE